MPTPAAGAVLALPPPARRRRLGRWLALAVLVLGGGWATLRAVRGPRLPVVRVQRQELTTRVVASGRVLPPARVSLGSVVLGTVARVHVEEGQAIRAGAPLVDLDDAEAAALVAQAQAGVDQAAARFGFVRDVSARVTTQAQRQATASLTLAEESFRRVQALAARGAVSPAELDEATQKVEVARSQRDSAVVQASGSGARGGDQRAAAAALAGARAALAVAQARQRQTRIVASVDGVVLVRAAEPGDVVSPGKTLIVLARDGETRLLVEPDEKNLGALALGQRARAVADAFPDRPFAAAIVALAPAVDPLRGTVAVKLHVPEPPPFLRPDMTVSVDVEVGRRPGVLAIPAEALRDTASDRPFVVRVTGGRTARRPVTLGARGEGTIEITAGLAEGDLVASPAAGLLTFGGRVRPVVGSR